MVRTLRHRGPDDEGQAERVPQATPWAPTVRWRMFQAEEEVASVPSSGWTETGERSRSMWNGERPSRKPFTCVLILANMPIADHPPAARVEPRLQKPITHSTAGAYRRAALRA